MRTIRQALQPLSGGTPGGTPLEAQPGPPSGQLQGDILEGLVDVAQLLAAEPRPAEQQLQQQVLPPRCSTQTYGSRLDSSRHALSHLGMRVFVTVLCWLLEARLSCVGPQQLAAVCWLLGAVHTFGWLLMAPAQTDLPAPC